MKKFPSILLSTFFLVLASFSLGAIADNYGCSNGIPRDMGDSYAQIVIYDDVFELVMHKSKILIPREAATEGESTFSIQETAVTMMGEGDVYPVELNMLAIFRKDLNELSLALSLDKAALRTIEMTCAKM